MDPRIEVFPAKKLIGLRMTMSLIDNKTAALWSSFMPRRKEIPNTVGSELYSMQIYSPLYFSEFSPATEFEKWAAVEVSDFDIIPEKMEKHSIASGLYAVFIHKGSSSDSSTFEYIFNTWLPTSNYIIDFRPHFEILGEKYKNNDMSSEEEIWIPIKPKK